MVNNEDRSQHSIPQYYDHGLNNGVSYLVMEYFSKSLQKYYDENMQDSFGLTFSQIANQMFRCVHSLH